MNVQLNQKEQRQKWRKSRKWSKRINKVRRWKWGRSRGEGGLIKVGGADGGTEGVEEKETEDTEVRKKIDKRE